MKKLAVLLISILILGSCVNMNKSANQKIFTLKYVAFYPNHTDTVEVSNNRGYEWYSYKGTNRILEYREHVPIYSSSAPYKILSYTETE
jgi:hypothetical protein